MTTLLNLLLLFCIFLKIALKGRYYSYYMVKKPWIMEVKQLVQDQIANYYRGRI